MIWFSYFKFILGMLCFVIGSAVFIGVFVYHNVHPELNRLWAIPLLAIAYSGLKMAQKA